MSELSIHELETEHAELLPEREALGINVFVGGFNTVLAKQTAIANAVAIKAADNVVAAAASNVLVVG